MRAGSQAAEPVRNRVRAAVGIDVALLREPARRIGTDEDRRDRPSPLGGTASWLAWVTVSCSPFGCLYAFGIRSAIWRTRASLLPVGSQLDQAAASGGAGRLARTTNVPTPAPTTAARAT